jgi:hypothetical protein
MNERHAPENVNNAPTIGDNSPQAHASVQDRAGLYIAIVALILATLSLGMQLTQSALIDAKIAAAIAPANETANAARTYARLANEKSDRVLAQLEARGLVKQENH